MGIRIQVLLSWAVFCFFSAAASAQVVPKEEKKPEGLMEIRIDEALQNALFRAGAFHVLPGLNVFGEYDSNGLSSSDNEQADYDLQALPSVLAVLPFKSRALFELYEAVHFIYYRELEDLRGIFDSTAVRFTIGGRRVVFSVGDEFHNERVRPTLEFDFPIDQRRNTLNTSLTLGLGERSELQAGLIYSTTTILEDIVNPTGIPLSDFFDSDQTRGYVQLKRSVSERTAFVSDFYYENINFPEQSVQPDAHTYAINGGFFFQARGNITGDARIGYKRILADVEAEADYSGLVGLGAVKLHVGERTTLGITYSRDARISVTDNNWFFIETRIIPSIEYHITRPLSILAQVGYGKSSYPRPGTIVAADGSLVEGEIKDDSIEARLEVRYKIKNYWRVFVLGSTFSRNSNLPDSEKNRYLIAAGMSTSF